MYGIIIACSRPVTAVSGRRDAKARLTHQAPRWRAFAGEAGGEQGQRPARATKAPSASVRTHHGENDDVTQCCLVYLSRRHDSRTLLASRRDCASCKNMHRDFSAPLLVAT